MSSKLYCPKCDNVLDITKSVPKVKKINTNVKTPSHVTDKTKTESKSESESLELDDSESEPSKDDPTAAYWICRNCMFSKPIEKGQLILSKSSSETMTDYLNYDKFKNRRYSKILRYTRNYTCKNKKCETNTKDIPREAVMYKLHDDLQIWYTCRTCGTYWK